MSLNEGMSQKDLGIDACERRLRPSRPFSAETIAALRADLLQIKAKSMGTATESRQAQQPMAPPLPFKGPRSGTDPNVV